MKIIQSNLKAAADVVSGIPELRQDPRKKYEEKTAGKADLLVTIAEIDGELVGVKIGYGISEKEYYIWLTGVVPKWRGGGVAQRLLEEHEKWARGNYSVVVVKTAEKFQGMVRFLKRNGYVCEGEVDGELPFRKKLRR